MPPSAATRPLAHFAERFGPRYMTRFACIGPACEDDCCHGWHVTVDEPSYRELKKAMDGSRAEREEFRSLHRAIPDAKRTPHARALVVLRDDGRCSRLDADRLCSTQRRYGEGRLSDTCASYPRVVSAIGQRLEVQATLSCPEAARVCLLTEDALDRVALPPEAVKRRTVQRLITEAPVEPYEQVFDAARDALWRLLSSPYALSSRLAFLAMFGESTQPFLHRGAELPCAKLLADADAALDDCALSALDRELRAIELADTLAFTVVVLVLRRRLSGSRTSVFGRLVAQALGGAPDASGALDDYVARRGRWRARLGARLDQILLNYAANHVLVDAYTQSPDLLRWSLGLMTRIAVLRFMVLMHPRLAAAESASAEEQRAALDAAAVEVVYSFTRAVEHDSVFRAGLDGALVDAGVTSAAHGALLARF